MESRRYSRQFKEQVTQAAMDAKMPVPEIATLFGVTVSQVLRWKVRRELEDKDKRYTSNDFSLSDR